MIGDVSGTVWTSSQEVAYINTLAKVDATIADIKRKTIELGRLMAAVDALRTGETP